MLDRFSRRTLLRKAAAASGLLVIGFDPQTRSWVLQGQARPKGLEDIPSLDGTLAFDQDTLEAFSTDHGNYIRRQPLAVLRPGSVDDIIRMVKYANQHNLQIAMRGYGHSRSGETLVEAGIIIDSRTLKAIEVREDQSVDAQPGAFLAEVYEAAFAKNLTLPAVPGCTELSVGGVLSVGGWGGTSHRFGAAVDSAQELEVATGEGDLVTCSPSRESELFDMVLAGMGQCGFIVRARIRLVPKPSQVDRWNLLYEDDLEAFLADQEQLALEGRFDNQIGRASRNDDSSWSFRIQVGAFHYDGKTPDLAALEKGLKFRSSSDKTRVPYRDHVALNTDRALTWPESRARRQLGDLIVFVPSAEARDVTREILAEMSKSPYGPAGFTFPVHNLARFRRPLFKVPTGRVAFSLWLFPRTVPAGDPSAHAAMMDESRRLFEKMRSVGGKCYIAHSSVPFPPSGWKDHFGPDTWRRLTAAKRKFDPNGVLSPGPRIFAST